MAADFYDILLPPQTLERLDNWGDLDSLALSLDSSAWETAGIYGLIIADGAVVSGTMQGQRQTVIPLAPAEAFTGESLKAVRIRTDSLTGTAKAGGSLFALRIRQDAGELKAQTGGGATFQRIRLDAVSGSAQAMASASWIRIRMGAGIARASASSALGAWLRIRTDSMTEGGQSGGFAYGYTVRGIMASGSVKSGQNVAFLRYRLGAAGGSAHGFGIFDPVRILHLIESEPAKSGESAKFLRIRRSDGVLGAKSGQSITTARLRQNVATGAAKSAENVTSQRVRLGSGTSEAVAASSAIWLRIRTDTLSASGTLSGVLNPLVVGNDRLYGWAYSGGTLSGQRKRTASGTLSASTGGVLDTVRIRTANLSGSAESGGLLSADTGPRLTGYAKLSGSLVGYILGHAWQGQARPQEGAWRPETAVPEHWQGLPENGAEWAQNEQKTQGWNELEHGSGEWVKHEQSSAGIWELGAGRGPAEWTASAGSEELYSGKEGVSTSSWHRADDISAAEWTGERRLFKTQWGRPDNRDGYGWRAVRA